MNIAIFIADSNGAFPVPAVKGGAVATLVEHLVKEGNKDNDNKLTIFSYYDKNAFNISKKYSGFIDATLKNKKTNAITILTLCTGPQF